MERKLTDIIQSSKNKEPETEKADSGDSKPGGSKKVQPKKKRFVSSNRYFTICVYTVITFTICLVIFKFINNWREARSYATSALSTLSPFLIAFLIAYFITPLTNRIDRILFCHADEKHFVKLHKFFSLLLAYVIVIGCIILILIFVIPQIIDSIAQLIRQSSSLYDNIINWLSTLQEQYPDLDLSFIQEAIDSALPDAISYVQSLMTEIIPMIYNASVSIISWIVNIILAFVISCYLMSYRNQLVQGIKRIIYALFDEVIAYKIVFTIKECNRIFSNFIIGKALDSLIMGILCFIFMNILGLRYTILISIVVGITNMIPYFGPFIGAIPGILILLIVSPRQALIFAILILALQQFDGNILGPKILGDSTGLHPIWIIFAITVGGALGGVIGMFLGVPVVAVLLYLMNNFFDYLLYKKKIQPDLTNVEIPEINTDNVFIPKNAFEEMAAEENTHSDTESDTDTNAAKTSTKATSGNH